MNSLALLTLILLNFIAIGLLPILFFRRDRRYNIGWLATAAPFFAVPAALLLGWFGVLDPPAVFTGALSQAGQVLAVILSVLSTALIAATVATHRVPLALWHQTNDAPVEIVTWGPYSRVRHPFYTSFLLALFAATIALPHVVTVGCLVYAYIALSITAAREERRLSGSEFGLDYQRYMLRTGRFFPGVGR